MVHNYYNFSMCLHVLIPFQGIFIENFITDSAIYRTKIHSYLLDRVCIDNWSFVLILSP